jgi:hypothetical protein
MKGMFFEGGDAEARAVIDRREGLMCNWWRGVQRIYSPAIRDKLTDENLNMHVNHFTTVDPKTKRRFCEITPFISLTAGTVERDTAGKTNIIRRARRTALWFGTNFGQYDHAYLFTCWVVLAPRAAVGIESVAEEVRDLNAYRSYSPFQPEGEIIAKIKVPDNQIKECQKWELDKSDSTWVFRPGWTRPQENKRFTIPEMLTNVRELV